MNELENSSANELLFGSLSEVEEFKILPDSENFCGAG